MITKKQEQLQVDEETKKSILGRMGFKEHQEKTGLYQKTTNEYLLNWDFRKTDNGRFYASLIGGGFLDAKDAKQMDEYTSIRNQLNGKNEDNKNNNDTEKEEPQRQPLMNTVQKIQSPPTGEIIDLRGNETDITQVIQKRNLDLIIKASKDPKKPGEGILYYDQQIGKFHLIEPSVELVDLISARMGNITVEILEKGTHNHIDENTGDMYQTYYAIVKATDTLSGSEGLGSAEEIIDFNEMSRNNNPRTFALTKAIRKAERNAKERLIPVPRKALVELVKEELRKYQKKQQGKQ